MPYHYLDHITRTPLAPEALEAMMPWLQERVGTSQGVHRDCVATRRALDRARDQAAALLGCRSPESVLWTSSGAEALVTGVGALSKARRSGGRLLTTRVERPEILKSVQRLQEREGVMVDYAPVGLDGLIDLDQLRRLAGPDTFLIATHLAHHDSGAVQPLEAIAAIAQDCGARLLIDGTTGTGWATVDVDALGIDYFALAPYRFYGPLGAGALVVGLDTPFQPLLVGGDQEWERRAGLENLPAIVGAGQACELATKRGASRRARCQGLRDGFHGLVSAVLDVVPLIGPPLAGPRLPHHLAYSFPGIEGEGLALLCDVRGVAIHSMTACSARDLEPSHTLMGMGHDKATALASVVLGFGDELSEDGVATAAEIFTAAVQRLLSLFDEEAAL